MTGRSKGVTRRRPDSGRARPSRDALPTLTSPPDSPEQRLMAAVLMQAVHDLLLVRSHPGLLRHADVDGWFDDRDAAWPFSFENLCAALSIDADAVREALASRSSRG
jgi:hypothetical protein